MGNHILKIESIDHVTHDVLRIVTNKPEGIDFTPGQAAHIAINKSGWQKEERPFTFTSLPAGNALEFTIKAYPEQHGVTNEMLRLKQTDEIVLHDVFGAITYKGEGVLLREAPGLLLSFPFSEI